MSRKPADYRARRRWQDEARARGEVPECGREVCTNRVEPAFLNKHTPLLYCEDCAALINHHNPGFCYPEDPQTWRMCEGCGARKPDARPTSWSDHAWCDDCNNGRPR